MKRRPPSLSHLLPDNFVGEGLIDHGAHEIVHIRPPRAAPTPSYRRPGRRVASLLGAGAVPRCCHQRHRLTACEPKPCAALWGASVWARASRAITGNSRDEGIGVHARGASTHACAMAWPTGVISQAPTSRRDPEVPPLPTLVPLRERPGETACRARRRMPPVSWMGRPSPTRPSRPASRPARDRTSAPGSV
jgi:hypothetical protein